LFGLKGPKHEIFGSGVFRQIRPVWVGALELGQKIQKTYGFGLKIAIFVFFSAAG
jgi:hypothetical protein